MLNRDPRNHAYYVNPEKLLGHDAILVTQSCQKAVDYNVKPFFEELNQLPNIDIMRNGVKENSLKVFYCNNFKVPEIEMDSIPVYRQLKGYSPY